MRFGNAKTVWIELLEKENYIMTIRDDGVGFDELHYGYGSANAGTVGYYRWEGSF